MDTKRIVFAKLAAISAVKTNFMNHESRRKINLSLSDELSATTEDVRYATEKLTDMISDAYSSVRNLIDKLPDPGMLRDALEEYQGILQEVLDNAESAADELGADPNVIPNYREAEVFMNKDIPVMMDLIDSYESKVANLMDPQGF